MALLPPFRGANVSRYLGARTIEVGALGPTGIGLRHSEGARIIAYARPGTSLDEWKGLIAARWTLLDVVESDGRKYMVARQNQPRIRVQDSLTEREQQVVALAVMRQHNKLIAYNLGVSHATVRVLMARAVAKFGAASRDDLVRRLQAKEALR
jgi:DNA-binding CsgD family transcriptional regulator